MIEKEISLHLDESTRVEVYCPDCNTGISLDLSKGQATISTLCPSCGKDRVPQDVVMAYKQLVDKVRQSKAKLKVRIRNS